MIPLVEAIEQGRAQNVNLSGNAANCSLKLHYQLSRKVNSSGVKNHRG